jgi:hypothetical protein
MMMVINNCEFRDVYREIIANGSRVFSQKKEGPSEVYGKGL